MQARPALPSVLNLELPSVALRIRINKQILLQDSIAEVPVALLVRAHPHPLPSRNLGGHPLPPNKAAVPSTRLVEVPSAAVPSTRLVELPSAAVPSVVNL